MASPIKALSKCFNLCPGLEKLFPPLHCYSHDATSCESNLQSSEKLVNPILFLFELNEVELNIKYYPGKGWVVGFEVDTGIENLRFYATPDEPKQLELYLGHVLLNALWGLLEAGWKPIIKDKRTWCKEYEYIRMKRSEQNKVK